MAKKVKKPELRTKFEERVGVSSDSLKPLFEAQTKSKEIEKLCSMIQGRIKDGRTANLKQYRIWAAIDEAYNAPFNQITPTLVSSILSRNLSAVEVMAELQAWGLSEDTLFTECEVTEKGQTEKKKVLVEKTFWKVLVPLVKAYTTMRLAKIFNDRNQYPFLKYEPFTMTAKNMVACEIITNLVSKMSAQYGFPTVLRQAILQALLYSIALVFPAEAWHYETDEDEAGKEYTKKEGLRYNIPHPTRMFWDESCRPSTLNYDTGCAYAGYWRVIRYGDIDRNKLLWNKTAIPYGANWFSPDLSGNYFTEIYPCVAQPPWPLSKGNLTREEEDAKFKSTDEDKAVFVTDLFCKLVPKDWGIGDWSHPVWFRFVVASDTTVIFAEPLPYSPVLYLGYDADENRAKNPSLALEIIPWQDHIGNLLSQYLMSAKQNLAKLVFYNKDIVKQRDIQASQTQSKEAIGITFIPYSQKERTMAQNNVEPMQSVNLPYQETQSLIVGINTVISIMERLLGMSSAEVGAAGAHVQSAEEIRIISSNTTTRVEYTSSFVDDFIEAWKQQIYEASQQFMDDQFMVDVTATTPEAIAVLKQLGFKMPNEPFNGKTQIQGDKSMLQIEAFVSTRDGPNRINNPQVAQVMMQTIQAVAANPQLAQVVGPQQLLDAMNRAAQLAGVPKDFKLTLDGQMQQAQMLQQLQEQLAQMQQQIVQAAQQSVQGDIQELSKAVVQIEGAQEVLAQKITEIFGVATQTQPEVQPPAVPQMTPASAL